MARTNVIPNSEFRFVDIVALHQHPDNPRKKDAYAHTNIRFKRLEKDLENGWGQDHPATVCPRDDGDGFNVLVGNRRLAVSRKLGIDRVPCVILKDLSRSEELRILHDHAQVAGLDAGEQLTAFKTLITGGLTGRDIAIRMGWFDRKGEPNLNEVNKYRRVYNLPEPIQATWVKAKAEGAKATLDFEPTGENLELLEEAIVKDDNAKYVGDPMQGPNFKRVYNKLKEGKGKPKKSYASKTVLEGLRPGCSKAPWLRYFVGILAGLVDGDIEECIGVHEYLHNQALGDGTMDRPAILDRPVDEAAADEAAADEAAVEPEAAADEAAVEPEAAADEAELVMVEPDHNVKPRRVKSKARA